jgi:hypothetical protein
MRIIPTRFISPVLPPGKHSASIVVKVLDAKTALTAGIEFTM